MLSPYPRRPVLLHVFAPRSDTEFLRAVLFLRPQLMKPSFSTTFCTAAMCVLVGCNRPGAALHTLCVLVALVERNSAAWLPELTDATWDKLLQSLFRKAHQAGGAVARMAMLCLERMTANPFWLNSHSFVSRLVNCMCQAGASVQGAPATALCASVLKRIAMSGEAMGHIVGKAVSLLGNVSCPSPHLTRTVGLLKPHTTTAMCSMAWWPHTSM